MSKVIGKDAFAARRAEVAGRPPSVAEAGEVRAAAVDFDIARGAGVFADEERAVVRATFQSLQERGIVDHLRFARDGRDGAYEFVVRGSQGGERVAAKIVKSADPEDARPFSVRYAELEEPGRFFGFQSFGSLDESLGEFKRHIEPLARLVRRRIEDDGGRQQISHRPELA
ncbi:MAG: hypothetical protein EOM26_07340 [Alphaproteobacteria bacterium]|nr:hypothetical protein [Alphaproteobacteria bacterium]